jgi:hypothetical protein
VLDDLLEGLAAVAHRVLHLRADLRKRALLPRHGQRGEVPHGIAGYAGRIEVRFWMAGRTSHARGAEALVAALAGRLVRVAISLGRLVACGMAVETARVLQHFARLGEERGRARGRIANAREGGRGAERVRLPAGG